MNEANQIVMIAIDKIDAHPDNPRKELGDISELAASIRAKGIMQNLTVVPWFTPDTRQEVGEEMPGYYRVIIGHRRLAAAREAGLTEVPCAIVHMSPQEQIETMLLENMQRADLTVYEQAQGFQMMMDFGDSIDVISEKTGFSKTTVRRRLKMAELDQDVLKSVSDRQISLFDFDRISEIKDINERNNVLKEIGTANFENKLKQAIQEQKSKADQTRWREAFERIGAKEITYKDTWSGEYAFVNPGYFDISQDTVKLDEAITEGVQYYFAFNWTSVYLRIKKENSAEEDEARIEREHKEAEKRAQTEALNEAFERAFELRKNFVQGLSETAIKKQYDTVLSFLIEGQMSDDYLEFDCEMYAELVGAEIDDDNMTFDNVKAETEASTYKALLAYVYTFWGDSPNQTFKDWYNNYRENDTLSRIYEFLISLGYEMSDEEIALQDGTHELFNKGEQE